jgi:hypothetical protein
MMKDKNDQRLKEETSNGLMNSSVRSNKETDGLSENGQANHQEHSPLCKDDFFYADLRAIAEDGAKED